MNHLAFLVKLTKLNIAPNHAKILLYIASHPGSFQKDMKNDLDMNPNVICSVIALLMAKQYVIQDGSYVSKQHTLLPAGEEIVKIMTAA